MSRVAITIPVRLASSRFPNKVIADLYGKPLMQWIWESAIKVNGKENVYFNTPDGELVEIANSFGAEAVVTDKYNCVLQQCSEAALRLNQEKGYDKFGIVQGDEPMVTQVMITHALANLLTTNLSGCCLYKKITLEEAQDVNTVKCVIGKSFKNDVFRYLSRSVVPGFTPEKYGKLSNNYYKQVCVFGFRIEALHWFYNTPMDEVEASEGIDLVRFTQRGFNILAVESTTDTQAVDTPEDLEKVKELMKNATR